jgi:hypothetical protein
MGHIKINNNIPVSPDKWMYAQDINPITQQYMRNTEHLLRIKKKIPTDRRYTELLLRI